MGAIISSYILPHPPIIVPEVGKGRESEAVITVNAVKKAAKSIKRENPTTIILTTPHATVFQDFIYLSVQESLEGNLGNFGASNVKLSFENNVDMINRIISYSREEGIYSGGVDRSIAEKYKISDKLDHGALVPLYFINKELKGIKLVHISIAGLPLHELYRFGICISKVVRDTDERVVFIASGDLSHRLSHDAPCGYNKRGREFDELVINSVKQLEIKKLLSIDESLCESAGECGLRSFVIMLGALDGHNLTSEVYSYEGPFGVGYMIARLGVQGIDMGRSVLKKVEGEKLMKMKEIRENEDIYTNLARNALETYVKEGRVIKLSQISLGLPDDMLEKRAGTFVSIKKNGGLRGCIGTIVPTKKSIAEEIINNAISSGTRDPRFSPVQPDELDELVYSVDVLKEAEPIKSINELDVVKYGVIVKSGFRSGLLLPNLEGVDTPEQQVSIALQKAGIRPDEQYHMERFEVVRHDKI